MEEEDRPKLPHSDFPTCSYDACENLVYKSYLEKLMKKNWSSRINGMSWCLVASIGISTALVAYFIDYMVGLLEKKKNDWIVDSIQDCDGCLGSPYAKLLGINAGFVAVAAVLVAIAPVAGGSGIPEIKCYLNGLRLPNVLSIKTLIAKATGVLFSVSGGLPCGKEGPMIHSGAILAAGISGAHFPFLGVDSAVHAAFLPIRGDKFKRDFISCGAAAGVSAAFGAPVGGVLFALEEGCSFWDTELTWRIFFSSIICAFTMAIFTNTGTGEKSLNAPGMIDFGDFSTRKGVPFASIEVLCFIAIGMCGGLMGAAFNAINIRITHLRFKRDKYLKDNIVVLRIIKIFEALLMSACVSSAAFFCLGALHQQETVVPSEGLELDLLISFKTNATYSPYGTLWLNSAADTLKLLFHYDSDFPITTLLIFGICYFALMVTNYGVAVPSGLFVPALVTGAVFGRIFGELLHESSYHTFATLDRGTYALVGAASFLAGVCRITFSLTVILIEATRDIAYALPLMFAIMSAKLVGDLFNKGIYDMHIEFRKLMFLESNIPEDLVRGTLVKDFMTPKKDLVMLDAVESVRRIVEVLKSNKFCGFPVSRPDNHTLTQHDGLMTRKRLLVLLKNQKFIEHRRVEIYYAHISEYVDNHGDNTPDDVKRVLAFMKQHDLKTVSGHVGARGYDHGTSTFTVQIKTLEQDVVLPSMIVSDISLRMSLQYDGILKWEEFNYPRTKFSKLQGAKTLDEIEEAIKTDGLLDHWIDLRPYMNPQPFLVPDDFSFSRCYKLFRSVGTRHILVINDQHVISGIVTRYDLWSTLHHLEHPPSGWGVSAGKLVRLAGFSESDVREGVVWNQNINDETGDEPAEKPLFAYF
eukprot:TRINITY_DN2529_c1_g2_i1.p1 TRINITY_DN2529_c1_g2~~TRINITY_DN2529_c1_g2_i1.p1  ORF type:complete len:866 (+),score=120.95 TRINITY_DN2529_c1_g2_i1:50-2647(+)